MANKSNKIIALEAMLSKIWQHRKKFYSILPITLIGTYLVICCEPRYYTCSVSLAPEVNGIQTGGALGSIASSMGLGSLSKLGSNVDAINVDIYPDLLSSNDFIAKLMPVEVQTIDSTTRCNYYVYIRDKQKRAWWGDALKFLTDKIKPEEPDTYNGEGEIEIFNLTKQQNSLFKTVKDKFSCSVDRKTDVITIVMTDQDPLVCATMCNEICQKLQEFIVNYRTHKAKIDYEYFKKLCEEAKSEYEDSRRAYANYADTHMGLILESYKSKIADLENEMQLRYNTYSALNTQMQMAQAKLQEATPAFTVIESATVPIKPAGPKRLIIAVGMTIIAFFATSFYILRHDVKDIFI